MASRNPGLKKANSVSEYTREQIIELQRCARDPIYFIRNYVKIKHPKRGKVPFALYDYQEELVRMYQGNRFNIILSARQTGKTETSCAFLLWYAIFQSEKTVLIASNKSTNAMELIGKIKFAYEELPHWLKPGIDADNWNKHHLGFDNKSRIVSTTTSKDSGRGLAISLIYCDELAFVKPHVQEEFWDSILPTISCITGDSLILTDGGFKTIESIIPLNADIGLAKHGVPLNVLSTDGLRSSDSYYVSKISEVFKVQTDTGMFVNANAIHPLTTASKDGYIVDRQIKELTVGDYVRVDINSNVFGKNVIPYADAYMLGGYIAEGWFEKQTRNQTRVPTGITISNTSEEFRKVYLDNGFSIVNSNPNRLSAYESEIYSKFIHYGIDPFAMCDAKVVPSGVLEGTKETVQAFLRGLYDGDGSVTSRGVTLTSTSFKLIYMVKLMLNNMGMVSTIHKTSGKTILAREQKKQRLLPQGKVMQSARDSYNLIIRLSDSQLFKDTIGFGIGYKQLKLNTLIESRSQNSKKKYRIPFSVVQKMVKRSVGYITKQEYRNNGLRLDKVLSGKQEYVNVDWLIQFRTINLSNGYLFLPSEETLLNELITDKVYWDRVCSITSIGEQVTYDLRVPGTHRFYQNGIMGHNTGGAMIITSTPNGDSNLFARMWFTAIGKEVHEREEDAFIPLHVKWDQPPGRDGKFRSMMIDKLGERKWEQEFECVSGDTLITVRDKRNSNIETITISELRMRIYINNLHDIGGDLLWHMSTNSLEVMDSHTLELRKT